MKKSIIFLSIALTILIFSASVVSAQISDCQMMYEKALLLYNAGMPDSALSMVRSCTENKEFLGNTSKETRARIFRLAALSSIMMGNPGEAEKYSRKLLANQPDYKKNKNYEDLEEFSLILDRITPQPSLRIGIYGGFNQPFLKLRKEYSNYALSSIQYNLNGKSGYQLGIEVDKAITRSIALSAGVGLNNILFKYNITGMNLSLQESSFNYNQKTTWIEIPVAIRYYFALKTFRPYLEAGVSGRFILNSMEKSGTYGKYWFTGSSNSNKILATFLTNYENFGFLGGGGACYELNKFSFRLGISYNYYLKNSGVTSKFNGITGYDDISANERFHYTDDINLISISHLQISIGFVYNVNYRAF